MVRRLNMKPGKLVLFTVLVLLANFVYVAELMKVKYTNLECKLLDESFGIFRKCFLKALARDTVSLNYNLQVHQLPLDNITVNAQLFQKGNGFRPYLYNTTADFCQFLQNPYRLMFWKIAYDAAKPFSNFNHTCPFDHDLIIDGMILNGDMFKLVPFPSNYYMVKMQIAVNNQYKTESKAYFEIYD